MKRWRVGQFEITLKEIIASVSIIAVMLLIGFIMSGKIESWQMDKNAEYYKAAKITDPEIFRYGLETNLGNAFAYGTLKAEDPVTYPEIGGEYLYIKKEKELYTMHTRTVTTTVNGKTQTKTEVYWTWDWVDSEEQHSGTISFMGIQMPYEKINRPASRYIDTIYISSMERYVYYGCGTEYTGTIYTSMVNGQITDHSDFYDGQEIDEVVDNLTSDNMIWAFWIVWLLATGILVYTFYVADNKWLD